MPDIAEELLDRANFYAYGLKRFDRAIELYQKYARLRPQDRILYIFLFYAQWFNKDYTNAWTTFEKRFDYYQANKDISEMAKFELKHLKLARRWDGKQSLAGQRVLVWGEEGIGDIVHFLRFLPLIKSLGGHVIFTTRYPGLLTLLEKQPYIDEPFVQDCDTPPPEYDYCIPLMSIPFLAECRDFPPPPYLQADTTILPGDKKKIGLCWAGDSTFFKDSARSHNLLEFYGLTRPEVQLVSLQKEARLDQGRKSMDLLEPPLNSLEDTAKIINGLDAVVSVDTCVIHLAGALNKKGYLLKAAYPEWRWGLDDVSTLWYPTIRVCRTVGELVALVNHEN